MFIHIFYVAYIPDVAFGAKDFFKLSFSVIQECLTDSGQQQITEKADTSSVGFEFPGMKKSGEKPSDAEEKTDIPEDINTYFEKLTGDDDDDADALKTFDIL